MALNPLNFFEVGKQIGAVNSPAAGPAQTIRNILQQAEKKGLIQAQSQAQGAQAESLAKFKQGLKPTTTPVGTLTQNPETGAFEPNIVGNVPVGTKFPSVPKPDDPFTKQIKAQIAGEGGGVPSAQDAVEAQRRGATHYDTELQVYVDANGNPV